MKKIQFKYLALILILIISCQNQPKKDLQEIFQNPPESAKPWVFWYWIKAAVSEEGITADLEAMKENGIGGSYLIPIQDAEDPPLYEPPAVQLTPHWWDMVEHAFKEADRLDLKLAMHACDGFAVAGGPWITPEKSMQKVVWSEMQMNGSQHFRDTLPQPETIRNYYRDIAVFAYPTPAGSVYSTGQIKPRITSNVSNEKPGYLTDPNNETVFKSDEPCQIQYAFDKPFTCRSINIKTSGYNYASHRLIVESSIDGIYYDSICRLEPPRHGWQEYEGGVMTHAIPPTTAKYFRFSYTTDGFEPGSEDLDAAKWSPTLKIQGLHLSGKPVIHQFRGKNGSMWRVGKHTDKSLLPDSLCIDQKALINISEHLDTNGVLNWEAPEGNWTVLRIGHTSTGKTNYIGGGGKGLECDKFNPEIAKFQFDQWFGKVYEKINPSLASEVLKIFHIDSWECGSQNWSTVFRNEFKERRGYDLLPYLPVMTGLPIENSQRSEQVLLDVRQTIDELITDNFFTTMANEARAKGCLFSCESVAPVMITDNMRHYQEVDIPMGEFWYNSPTHDKPTDVLDAISAGHVYGKNVIQSEAFTTLRMDWSEHPAMLKTLGDRNFALGVNRFVFHVYAHNPWMDRQPGMTMNTVGLYFQRDQTWWDASNAWIDYLTRSQALLQQGKPVVDIAVFTGEEMPRRAMTPDRLVDVLPGLFGEETIVREQKRLANEGVPRQERPYSVTSSANTYDPANWIDPLGGYQYDAFNKDALLQLAEVKNGHIVLPGGASYRVLVLPGRRKMDPAHQMSLEVAQQLLSLVNQGATLMISEKPTMMHPVHKPASDSLFANVIRQLYEGPFEKLRTKHGILARKNLGKGQIIKTPYQLSSLKEIGVHEDLMAYDHHGQPVREIAWAHRSADEFDIYFVSNQLEEPRSLTLSLRTTGKIPDIYNPVTGTIQRAQNWRISNGRTKVELDLPKNGSVFIVLADKAKGTDGNNSPQPTRDILRTLNKGWQVTFDTAFGGPRQPVTMDLPQDWNQHANDSIKYYSGTTIYSKSFTIDSPINNENHIWLDLGEVRDIARVKLNDQSCGIAWTHPFRVDVTDALQQGNNHLEIHVTNSWKNRIIGDNTLEVNNETTQTTAPFRLEGHGLERAGLVESVELVEKSRE